MAFFGTLIEGLDGIYLKVKIREAIDTRLLNY